MKLSSRDAAAYVKRPDSGRPGLLIYGPDAMRVAEKRQQVIAALAGGNAGEEMRLTRLHAPELRKDPAQLLDALKAQGFFPGPRVVHVEDANDQAFPAIEAALAEWREGDASLVVTAGQLRPTSKLRKLFETHATACAAAIYGDPPTRSEVEADLAEAGLTDLGQDVLAAILDLSRALEPGDFRQTLAKLGLYKRGDVSPVTLDDLEAVAPRSIAADLDDAIDTIAEGRVSEIGPLVIRLAAQGTQPVALCIGATRHFRRLHVAASDPNGAGSGIGKLRPPVFGPRRDRMLRQAQSWGMHRLERALAVLTETDLQLRSTSGAPPMALMERALIRLAMMARR